MRSVLWQRIGVSMLCWGQYGCEKPEDSWRVPQRQHRMICDQAKAEECVDSMWITVSFPGPNYDCRECTTVLKVSTGTGTEIGGCKDRELWIATSPNHLPATEKLLNTLLYPLMGEALNLVKSVGLEWLIWYACEWTIVGCNAALSDGDGWELKVTIGGLLCLLLAVVRFSAIVLI